MVNRTTEVYTHSFNSAQAHTVPSFCHFLCYHCLDFSHLHSTCCTWTLIWSILCVSVDLLLFNDKRPPCMAERNGRPLLLISEVLVFHPSLFDFFEFDHQLRITLRFSSPCGPKYIQTDYKNWIVVMTVFIFCKLRSWMCVMCTVS